MPGPAEDEKIVQIEKGTSIKGIADILEDKGLVSNAFAFELYARYAARENPAQAGEYVFAAQSSMADILAKLQSGEVILHHITIPEGFTNYQIRQIVESDPLLKGDIKSMPPEGYLLPETYNFPKGLERQEFIDRMHKAKMDLLDSIWSERVEGLPISSKEDAVILASIVEKETAVPEERNKVAGVFINRLNKNMRLQSDPTVIYALTAGVPPEDGPGALGRRLLRKDLDFDSPYNTYKYAGLPPGPICNPGEESLRAVLKPESHDYFYFVADGTGGHAFARTLAGHNKNVAAWRKIRRQQESSD